MLNKKEGDLLYSQQVAQLYALAPLGIVASLINGPILTFIQWKVLPQDILLLWLTVLVLLNGFWIILCSHFKKAVRPLVDPHYWNRMFVGGTLASGLVWGSAGFLTFPDSSLPHQIFLAFVLGGMVAGGTAVYAAREEAFWAYAIPTLTPLLGQFFLLKDELHWAMGGMGLLFLVLMCLTAHRNHTVTVDSMALHIEFVKANKALQKEILERTQAETALRHSQEQLHSIVQSTDEGIISLNRHGHVILWNTGAAHMFGFSEETMLGQPLDRIIPQRYHSAYRAGIQRATETENQTPPGQMFELIGLRRDGSEFPLELFLGYWHQSGEIFFTGFVRDISARKQAEKALQRRERELKHSREELQALGAQLISAQENERRRISRELHDDMNQRLAIVALHIQSVQRHMAQSDPMQETLQLLNDQISSLSDNVRHLAYQLHPSILDDLGLVVALQSFINDFCKWGKIAVSFRPQNVPSILPPDIALCVYRVAQECLRNVAKHAQATHVSIEVTGIAKGLQLTIADNGKGFIPAKIRRGTHGLGLIGMKERIRLVHGTFTVKTSKDKGTSITAWIPLPHTT